MTNTENRRLATVAVAVLALDQITKKLVNWLLPLEDEKVIIPGFFKLVHWGNTGAAWSLFTGNNSFLAFIAIMALIILYRSRHHFEVHRLMGQIALGLIFGGILGNLVDRLLIHHVTDFLRFYMDRRGADPIGFPAFNIADSAICIGVGLLFILSWRSEKSPVAVQPQA